MPLKIFSREEWGAAPPKKVERALSLPARVVLTYATNTPECKTKLECIGVLQKMQRSHFKRGMSDIAYNFLIGGDGDIYEGRGWGVEPSQKLALKPGGRIDIAFIGNHRKENIPTHMFKNAFSLLVLGQEKREVSKQCDIEDILMDIDKRRSTARRYRR